MNKQLKKAILPSILHYDEGCDSLDSGWNVYCGLELWLCAGRN